MRLFSFLIMFCLITSCVSKRLNPCTKCFTLFSGSVQTRLSDEDIYKILCGYEEECVNNVEYQEQFNERLFKLLEYQPKQFIMQLSNFDTVKIQHIVENFANPVNDLIVINPIKSKVIKTKTMMNGIHNQLCDLIILKLDKALLKF